MKKHVESINHIFLRCAGTTSLRNLKGYLKNVDQNQIDDGYVFVSERVNKKNS